MLNRLSFDAKNETINPGAFACLNGNDVITAKVSDHHPVIHNGVLFWNIMMQGRIRNGRGRISYNNGFAIVENEKQYVARLIKVSHVIAEIVYRNPSIETIGLCEGPIEPLHVSTFLHSLRHFNCMRRFFKNNEFYKPNVEKYPYWGLLMLTDRNDQVNEVRCNMVENSSMVRKLANRFQLWRLTRNKQDRYFALAHFPFGGDEHVTENTYLSGSANWYRGLINHLLSQYSQNSFVFCADFNFNPYLINQWKDRVLDQVTHNNSILITAEEKVQKHAIKAVTVEGILLSAKSKQQLYTSLQPSTQLLNRLRNEYRLFKSCFDKSLEEKRHHDLSLQEEYDKRYSLVPCY